MLILSKLFQPLLLDLVTSASLFYHVSALQLHALNANDDFDDEFYQRHPSIFPPLPDSPDEVESEVGEFFEGGRNLYTLVHNKDSSETVQLHEDDDRTNMVDSEVNDRTNMVDSEVNDRTNGVEEGHDRTSVVEEGHDRTSVVEEVNDRTNMVDEVNDRTNMVEEGHDRTSVVEEGHDRTSVVEEVNDRTNMVDEVNDRTNMVEEGHDRTSVVEEVNDRNSVVDEVNDRTRLVEEVKDRTNMVDEVNDRTSVVDEVNDLTNMVDEVNDLTSVVDEVNDRTSVVEEVNDRTSVVEEVNDLTSVVDEVNDRTSVVEEVNDRTSVVDEVQDRLSIFDTDTVHDHPKIANTNVTANTETHHAQPDISDIHHSTVNENPVTDIGDIVVPNNPIIRVRDNRDIPNSNNITKADCADSEVRDLVPAALADDLNKFYNTPVNTDDAKRVETVTPQIQKSDLVVEEPKADVEIITTMATSPDAKPNAEVPVEIVPAVVLCGSGGSNIDDIDGETQIGLTDDNVKMTKDGPGLTDDIEVIDLNSNDVNESELSDSTKLNDLQRQRIQKFFQFLIGGVGSNLAADIVLKLPVFINQCALAAGYSKGLADVTSYIVVPIAVGTAGYEMVKNLNVKNIKDINKENLLKSLKNLNPSTIGVIGGLLVSSNREFNSLLVNINNLGRSPGPDGVPLPVDRCSICKMAKQQYFHQFGFTVLQSLTIVLVQKGIIPTMAGAAMPFIVAYTGAHLLRDLYQLDKKLKQLSTESEESSDEESSGDTSKASNSESYTTESKSTSPLLSRKNLIRSTETLTSSVVSSACAMYSVNANIAGQISAVAASLGLQNYILNDQLMKIGTPIVVGYVSYKASKDLIKILGKGMRFVRRKLVDSGKNNTRTSDADEGLGMGKQDGDGGVGMGKR